MSAVLFDMDGTLIDTPAGILQAHRAVLDEFGVVQTDAVVRATIGRPLAASCALLLGLAEDHADVVRAVERFRQLFTELVVPNAVGLIFPGVAELLGSLREQGLALAVVTSKGQRGAEELLGAAGLMDSFDAIVCHGMALRGKPHPDLALLAASTLGIDQADCVVVGDAVDDMRMAVSAGMAAYGVGYGVATPEELREAGAQVVLGTVAELADALQSRFVQVLGSSLQG